MLTITTNSFENDVLHADKPLLVDFWAQWCPYCRRIAPAFDKVGEQYADTLITGKINYDEEPQLIERFGFTQAGKEDYFQNISIIVVGFRCGEIRLDLFVGKRHDLRFLDAG